jgi:hypothetical protein
MDLKCRSRSSALLMQEVSGTFLKGDVTGVTGDHKLKS